MGKMDEEESIPMGVVAYGLRYDSNVSLTDGEYAQLWSTIRSLSNEVIRLDRVLWKNGLDYSKGAPVYEIWYLYWRVFWGWILKDAGTGHRLEYARNVHTLRNRPLMLFLITFGMRYRFAKKRLYGYWNRRRIRRKQAKIDRQRRG